MTLRLTLAVALAAAAFAPAAAARSLVPNYQPLAQGDERTYERSDAFGAAQHVPSEVDRDLSPWFRFDDFLNQRDIYVAYHQMGVYVWDAAQGRIVKLFDFTASVGDSWAVDFSGQFGAGGRMTLSAVDETVSVGAGTFRDCYRFTFDTPPGVADAGWGAIWFAEGVGVVKWTENSFAGPVRYELATATVGGVTYPQPTPAGGVSTTLEADRYEYVFPRLAPVANIYATVTLTVTNATGTPIDVTYGSGQTFEIQLIDVATGNVEWTWSANKSFIQIVRQEQITGTQTFSDSVPLPARDADYEVRMFLTTTGVRKPFAASTPIRVRVR